VKEVKEQDSQAISAIMTAHKKRLRAAYTAEHTIFQINLEIKTQMMY